MNIFITKLAFCPVPLANIECEVATVSSCHRRKRPGETNERHLYQVIDKHLYSADDWFILYNQIIIHYKMHRNNFELEPFSRATHGMKHVIIIFIVAIPGGLDMILRLIDPNTILL